MVTAEPARAMISTAALASFQAAANGIMTNSGLRVVFAPSLH
jgi:hypothetical protein